MHGIALLNYYFESVEPNDGSIVEDFLSPFGHSYPQGAEEITALGWYDPLRCFIAADLAEDFYHIYLNMTFLFVEQLTLLFVVREGLLF